MVRLDRRSWLGAASAGALATCLPLGRRVFAGEAKASQTCTLSIGTYSLKGMSVEDAITFVAETGYDGIEISVQPGFDGEPSKLTTSRRDEIKRRLGATHLKLTALMENLPPAVAEREHREHLERLQRVVELARQLVPNDPPLVQTVLGGGKWEEKKTLFRDRLGDWGKVFQKTGILLAIKPHRGGSMSRPEEAIWLIEQLGKPMWLRMVYDYGHYAFRDMPLEETIRTALPVTAHIAVKDAVQKGDKIEFQPPGESRTFDYGKLLRLFWQGGYRGDVCCEVSAMVTKRPDYDPVATAKACYKNMAAAFQQAGVPRPKR